LMKQPQYAPMSVAEMGIALYAVNEGYLDDVDVENVVPFETALHAHARANAEDLMARIDSTGAYDDEIKAGLKALLDEFKTSGAY